MKLDVLVVGAGFAGCVAAERLASAGRHVLMIDKRHHIGGNAFDELDDNGVLIHRYGPHIFHTNAAPVAEYLSRFTEWRPYEHRVLASLNGTLYPIPVNQTTINILYGLSLDESGVAEFFDRVREARSSILTSEDRLLSTLGRDLCDKFFRGYTRKQWGLDLSELSASVAARIPVRTNADDRYFSDSFQKMPADGFTKMFARMIDHPLIRLELGVNFRAFRKRTRWNQMLYTGPVDEYFDFRFGELPYRSLRFEHEHLAGTELFQPVGTVNYPNDYAFTRITEFKHLTGQVHGGTSIVREYPQSEGDAYYPIPRPENQELYRRYQELTAMEKRTYFVGRLAQYKYYNMDQVIAAALKASERAICDYGKEPQRRSIVPISGTLQAARSCAASGIKSACLPSVGNTVTTIAAVVVTCNRKQLLAECLDALLNQTRPVDCIFVIDQASTDGTFEMLRSRGYLSYSQMRYDRSHINTGGAGGFCRGMQLAHAAGFRWIWIMDDDAIAVTDALQAMLPYAAAPGVVAIANPKLRANGHPDASHIQIRKSADSARSGPVALSFSSFVGLMVRREAIDAIGFPKAEFFLYLDDHEYCRRLCSIGAIVLAEGAAIHHKQANSPLRTVRRFGRDFCFYSSREFAFRFYFTWRNSTWLALHGHAEGVRRLPALSLDLIKAMLRIFLIDRTDVFARLYILVRAAIDGLCSRFDNAFPSRMQDSLAAAPSLFPLSRKDGSQMPRPMRGTDIVTGA
jgi:UDP-galactopyranose mutase